MLRSDLCDFSDVYIVVKGDINLKKATARDFINIRNKFLTFKSNAPVIGCISTINNTLIDNAEDLDVVMPMYNLLEHSKNYKKTTGNFWNYYKDEPNNPRLNDDDPPIVNYSADSKTNTESFKYKGSIANQEDGEDTEWGNMKTKRNLETVVPLKYSSNFWRSLDMRLIDCEVSVTLTWSENCILTDTSTRAARAAQGNNPEIPAINAPTNATFKIKDTKLYVPVVTLSIKDDNNFWEQLTWGFKRTIKSYEYRSEMTNQTKTNNLNYLVDPIFNKVNRLFVLSFENEEGRTSFSKYYLPKVEIKDCNVLIDGKCFFWCASKKQRRSVRKN